MVLSGTPYLRATAQMEFEPIMAITTSARTAAGYFFPRPCLPGTVFLQYFRPAMPVLSSFALCFQSTASRRIKNLRTF